MKKTKENVYNFLFNTDMGFLVIILVILGICYLLAFIITHVFGIDHITVHTSNHGNISMTTGIFFIIALIPLMIISRYLNDEDY